MPFVNNIYLPSVQLCRGFLMTDPELWMDLYIIFHQEKQLGIDKNKNNIIAVHSELFNVESLWHLAAVLWCCSRKPELEWGWLEDCSCHANHSKTLSISFFNAIYVINFSLFFFAALLIVLDCTDGFSIKRVHKKIKEDFLIVKYWRQWQISFMLAYHCSEEKLLGIPDMTHYLHP